MTDAFVLLDASAFRRLSSPQLDAARRTEVSGWIARGIVAASTPLLLETRAGRDVPAVDPGELPLLWITERAERRAAELQQQLRAAHQQLGVPPLDYLIAAIAEAHGASILHYDADFDRLAFHTDLAAEVEPLAPLGTLVAEPAVREDWSPPTVTVGRVLLNDHRAWKEILDDEDDQRSLPTGS